MSETSIFSIHTYYYYYIFLLNLLNGIYTFICGRLFDANTLAHKQTVHYFYFYSCVQHHHHHQHRHRPPHRDLIMNDCICLHGIYYRICVHILPIKKRTTKLCGNGDANGNDNDYYNSFSSLFFCRAERKKIEFVQKRKGMKALNYNREINCMCVCARARENEKESHRRCSVCSIIYNWCTLHNICIKPSNLSVCLSIFKINAI